MKSFTFIATRTIAIDVEAETQDEAEKLAEQELVKVDWQNDADRTEMEIQLIDGEFVE